MSSDKCNLIMAIATEMISSLFDVASSGDVPFYQCLHHGSLLGLLPKVFKVAGSKV